MSPLLSSNARPRRVSLKRVALESYRGLVGDRLIAETREIGESLRGTRVLELSSTASGGGVAELLSSLVPLERDLGIEAEWPVIAGDPRFFDTTKRIHNGLQGMEVGLDEEERSEYLRQNEANAAALDGGWDAIVVHDPQPAAIPSFAPELTGHWLWRCHIDPSAPHRPVWEFLHPYVERFYRAIFTLESFIPPDLRVPTECLLPAIDPITSKNQRLPDYLARETVAALGVDLAQPLLLQVSRFDPWKDPLAVVEVWRGLRATFSTLQLALVGSMATIPRAGASMSRSSRRRPRSLPAFSSPIRWAWPVTRSRHFSASPTLRSRRAPARGSGSWSPRRCGRVRRWSRVAPAGYPSSCRMGSAASWPSRWRSSPSDLASCSRTRCWRPKWARAGAEAVGERFLMPRLLRDHLAVLRELVA